MSFGDGGQIASGGSTANNQTNLTVATTAAVSAGDLVVVAVTVDNQNATGGDQGDVSGVTIGGVGLTKGRQNAQAIAAQTGAAVSLWYGQPGALSSGVNIIATFANATTSDASALSARKFTVPSGATITLAGTNATTGTTTNPGSLDFTGANVAHLRIRAIGCEFDSTQALTVTGSWTAWTEGASSASGTTTEQVIEVEHRIVTGTTGASAPTLGSACDSASVYLAFTETTQGTLAISGSSSVAFVGEAVLPATPTPYYPVTFLSPIIFSRTLLYPDILAPPLDRVYKSGTLAISGSTNVAFIGTGILSGTFTISGSTTITFVGPAPAVPFGQINITVIFSKTILHPTLIEPAPQVTAVTINSGTLSISGSSTPAFIGSAVLSGTLSISGSTTAAFSGAATVAGTFSVNLGTAVAWVGSFTSTGSGAMIVSGSTTVAFIGASTAAGTLTITGQTTVAFIGASTAAGTLSISGSTTVAFSGSAVKPTTLTIAGSTTIAFTGRSTAAGVLSIAGSTTASFSGSAVKPTTLAISGSSTPAFTGRATAAGTLGVSVGTAVAFVGSFTADGTGLMIVSGSTTVAFVGRSIAQGSATIGGSTTIAFIGRATVAAQFSISGSTTITFNGAFEAIRSGQFTIAGSTTVSFLSPGLTQSGTLSIFGNTDILFLGENATVFVPPREGYESQVGVWHVREVPRRGGRSRWSGRTGKRYRIYGTIFEQPVPSAPLWILDNGYWHDDGIWIDTKTWED